MNPLADAIRGDLLYSEGVTKFSPNRRFATVFSVGNPADTVYYVDSGLVKLYKHGDDSKEIIVDIVFGGQLFGEQAILAGGARSLSAEILLEGVIYCIPRTLFLRYCDEHPALWRMLTEKLISQKHHLEQKIELLCLQDVESRILHYMVELAGTIGTALNGHEQAIPLSQGELASLIGATRETTSTTLNNLARRGLVRLGRRQLILVSAEESAVKAQSLRAVAR